ncbi:hypothetical protein N7539_001874 [Penicillium diatomitis]|uniref:ARID domain-containing protein n=1 Tax=Penicillium diatomitis TaxID=2819901 RepID=A0A9W9XHJ4_9EURO|nr:uncharacterized protein N7539_001874 [Penicillium diatomitis]KAJ5493128.1 hypothetical protein N7539_001874 [Penicillium diatomitis]
MNDWPADASNIPGQNNGAFIPPNIDSANAFFHASSNPPDPNQYQRMFNGVPHNASPVFHNPNQVIPSKRARPEDGMPMSPRPGPGTGVTGSRSQTPHQVPFPGYQGPANGTQFPQHPTPYQHLQQGASPSVTQSPILQDFDQQSARMGTASPSPYSPAGPHVGNSQMSPSQPDASRVNTPQNGQFMAGQPYPQSMNPQFQQGPGMPSAAQQSQMQAQQFGGMSHVPQNYHQAIAQQQQRLRQMQMQQNQQMNPNLNPQMGGRPAVPSGMNPMASNSQQMAAIRQLQQQHQHQHQHQQNMGKPNNPEMFTRTLQKFMMSRNLPFDPNPIVSGRPIAVMQLYGTVMKMGGSKKITAMNMWPMVAQQLQFPPGQFPMAPQELREYHQRNLAPYEQAYFQSQSKQYAEMQHQQQQQQQQQQHQQQQQQQPHQPQHQPPLPHPQQHLHQQQQQQQQPQHPHAPPHHVGVQRQPSDPSLMQFQSPQPKQGPSFEPSHAPIANTPQTNTPISTSAHATPSNGFATPTQPRGQSKPPQPGHRLSVSRQSLPPAPPPDATAQFAAPSPSQQSKASVTPVPQPVQPPEPVPEQVFKRPIEDPFRPMIVNEQRLHGPIQVDDFFHIGEEISALRPTVPSFAELGIVDIHALTMSLKSGIHAEIRLALDTLITISSQPSIQISLDNTEDLIESLVDCADEQADFLSEHIEEVSEQICLRSYEDVTRGCQFEHTALGNVYEFGSIEYELNSAIDRLICITTILRNLSFSESNFESLGIPAVTQCLANIFRNIGTRDRYLRTDQNLLDFMKDAVIFMSNLAHMMQVPGKEEALSLLHFLLAFSPSPGPCEIKPGQILFAAFNPSVHRYTPAAVDGLAKLLARDDPNRLFFGAIFLGDGSAASQKDLLTRAFGLAICAIPDRRPLAVADARLVFLMQGLLAADVLTTFADGVLAKQWLNSVDGFAAHLLRVSCLLCTERLSTINPRQNRQAETEAFAYSSIIHRGLGILRRLAEKSKQVDGSSPLRLPSGILPSKESLLGALLLANMDPAIIRQLLTYANLAE